MTGLSDSLIYQILSGDRNVSANTVAKVALALGVSADELLGLRPGAEEVARLERQLADLREEAAEVAASFPALDDASRELALAQLREIHETIADLERRLEFARKAQGSLDSENLVIPLLGSDGKLAVKADCAARLNSPASPLAGAGDAYVLVRKRASGEGPFAVRRNGGVEVTYVPNPGSEVIGEVVGYWFPASPPRLLQP